MVDFSLGDQGFIFEGKFVKVSDFEGISSEERVVEFKFRDSPSRVALHSISVPYGGSWSDAEISIDPQTETVSLAYLMCTIDVARMIIESDSEV